MIFLLMTTAVLSMAACNRAPETATDAPSGQKAAQPTAAAEPLMARARERFEPIP
jgi:hypothetical protein